MKASSRTDRRARGRLAVALAVLWGLPCLSLVFLLSPEQRHFGVAMVETTAGRWFEGTKWRARAALSRLRSWGVAIAGPPVAPPPPLTFPLLPRDNWWNVSIEKAPVDPRSDAIIRFIGPKKRLHPDFGGVHAGEPRRGYGLPYVVVKGDQPKRAVTFEYKAESDHPGVPFYPIPDEAIDQPYFIEGGPSGREKADGGDRHLIIVDETNRHLYELFAVSYDGSGWKAGSGAFFDLNTNGRRPEGWTSADAAGLAILPGLVRYDEVFGPDEIRHAFRATVHATNGYVWPASHQAGGTEGAPPLGARLRLKASTDIARFPSEAQKIFRAMQRYGLIIADNGSDIYVTGTFDPRWQNEVLNPAFHALVAADFEVVHLGYRGDTTE